MRKTKPNSIFEKGKYYTHKRMLDSVIKVLNIVEQNGGGIGLSIKWFNKNGMDLGLNEIVYVKNEEFKNWYLFLGE